MPYYNYPEVPPDAQGVDGHVSGCGCAGCRTERDDRGIGGYRATWDECSDCGDVFDRRDEGDDGYCGECARSHCTCGDCSECLGGYVHDYSYRPEPNFLASDEDLDAGRLYMGIELEVPTDDMAEMGRSIAAGPGADETVLYCKTDSSIVGVEIVSHPMTHAYFRESFPFDMFDTSSPQSRLLSDRTPNTGYGMHVHVSRKGFKSESHAVRWMLLVYRNAVELEKLARRSPNRWAGFTDIDACEQKAAAPGGHDRYVAINSCNEDTHEVRIFRSTWTEQEFRAAVDFVHASVVYTRKVTAAQAVDGALSWSAFRSWLDLQEKEGDGRYDSLQHELRRLAGEDDYTVDHGDVRSREDECLVARRNGRAVAFFVRSGYRDSNLWVRGSSLADAREEREFLIRTYDDGHDRAWWENYYACPLESLNS